jgi:hypothetical protein
MKSKIQRGFKDNSKRSKNSSEKPKNSIIKSWCKLFKKVLKKIKRKFYYWEPIYRFCHWYSEFKDRNSIDLDTDNEIEK